MILHGRILQDWNVDIIRRVQGIVLIMGNIARNGNTWQSGFHHLLVFFMDCF